MEYLVWVGPRDSDMKFSKSIKEVHMLLFK